MKALTIGCILVAVVAVLAEGFFTLKEISPHLDKQWEDFKTVYRKTYTGDLEVVKRLVWESNLRYIQEHNIEYDLGRKSFTLGLNEFSDLTAEELKATRKGLNLEALRDSVENSASQFLPPMNTGPLPPSVDWRTKGYVTPIKDQGQCGSCWAFSSTGSLEGQWFRKTGKLVSLSEQQLIDCSQKFGNEGCNGGLMNNAFKYILANKGLDTEVSYPYQARDGNCRFNPSTVGATVTGFQNVVPRGNETALAVAVAAVGPISIAIDASNPSFQAYRSGIYREPRCSSSQLDHGVLVVGYGVQNNVSFWIVKNSWGPSWGEQGYIRMLRGARNQCGVASMASYPLV